MCVCLCEFILTDRFLLQKSKEKNIALEENRKRIESSLARKRVNGTMTNGGGTDSPISPTSSGAMDSLLEKLRAAAPQAKDQRDRRRRARLKERHQVRVASGQKLPNLLGGEADDVEGASIMSTVDGSGGSGGAGGELLAPQDDAKSSTGGQDSVSEGEDIADRAANLLQGLRLNSGDTDEERTRRRRESAEDERRARRLRMRSRNAATSGSKDSNSADGALPSVREASAIPEGEDDAASSSPIKSPPATPAIVVSSEAGDCHTAHDNNNDNNPNNNQRKGDHEAEEEEHHQENKEGKEDTPPVMDGSSPDQPMEISD